MRKIFFKNATIIWIFLFCIFQLSGCSFIGRHFAGRDGAPNVDIDVSKIPDAIPKNEPRSAYGNKDYVVYGHSYHVLKSSAGYVKRGYASWYGTKFHNHLTSTHERYNVFSMTAASRELPLPTYAEITNLKNGNKVIVKVNDRGPFKCNRILDLSYAAAKKLGFANQGLGYVEVRAIDYNSGRHYASATTSSHISKHGIYLQVGAYAKLESAKHVSQEVTKITNKPINISHNVNLYRVQIGPLASVAQSDQLKQILLDHGYDHAVTIKS